MRQCHATPSLRQLISGVIFARRGPDPALQFLRAELNARISPGILNTLLRSHAGFNQRTDSSSVEDTKIEDVKKRSKFCHLIFFQ
jgi:hypothetical protein